VFDRKHPKVQRSHPRWPFICCWNDPNKPLPKRTLRIPMRRSLGEKGGETATGSMQRPFDFCGHMERLCADIGNRCLELRHVDVARILFAVTRARNRRSHGLQARVTPLRFREGRLRHRRRGVTYQVQRYQVESREILYLVTFCLPRFLDLDINEKFITLFHELYHISPAFNGDLRRHNGRYSIHSHSQRAYDRQMAELARKYLAGGADPELHSFLGLNFRQLQQRHGGVAGIVVPRPKIIPVEDGDADPGN